MKCCHCHQEIADSFVFEFHQLDDAAKKKAINSLRDINVDHSWWEGDYHLSLTEEQWLSFMSKEEISGYFSKGKLSLFSYDDIYFSIDRDWFLSFKNLQVENQELLRRWLGFPTQEWDRIAVTFSKGTHRYPQSSDAIVLQWESRTPLYDATQKRITQAEEKFRDLVADGLKDLRKTYEYLVSDEAVIETIEANEYKFNKNGVML